MPLGRWPSGWIPPRVPPKGAPPSVDGGWPSYEDIGRELKKRLQDAVGVYADVYLSDRQAIEVTAPDGAPVQEVLDKPKLAIFGPVESPRAAAPQFGPTDRPMVSKDTDKLTFVDAPSPEVNDLTYQITGYAVRDTSTVDGTVKGFKWLMQRTTLFMAGRIGGNRLLGAGWHGDMPSFKGYRFIEVTSPTRLPGQATSLSAFSCRLVVQRVMATDGSRGGGQLVGEVNFDPEELTEV